MLKLLRGKRGLLVLALAAIGCLVFSWAPAFAQQPDAPTLESLAAATAENKVLLDTMWVIIAAVLVFFMQAGFANLEAGLTRAKNANNIMMKNLMDFSIGTIAFWVVGFALMFGVGNAFMGLTGFFLNDHGAVDTTFESLAWTSVPLPAKFIFQLVFAATAATIVSGAMAERTKFKSYLIYSVVISAFIYPLVGHWIWGGGWLASLGMWDFAGSTVVHSTGGWVALAGAVVLGPRLGKYGADGKPRPIPGHNLPMAALGVFILWLGWFGFNAGSTMAADLSIAHIAATTNIAAASGAIAAMITAWMIFGKPDVSMALNGALAGLVTITAGCAFVEIWAAGVMGLIGGVLVVIAVVSIERVKIDDPVGAISVHGVCGALGTLLLGVFAMPGSDAGVGLIYGGGTTLLVAQAIGVVAVFAWAAGTGFLLFYAIKFVMGLRVTEREEIEGLDVGEHGSSAYPDFGEALGAASAVASASAASEAAPVTASAKPIAEAGP